MALIEREALRKHAVYLYGFGAYKYVPLKVVEKAPTINAAPVVHGRWEICSDGYYPYCSVCKAEPKSGVMTRFCPACGSRMDGGENDG